MSRIFATAAAGGLVLALLTGCGGPQLSEDEAAAAASSINAQLEQIGTEVGDQIAEVRVRVSPQSAVQALVLVPEKAQWVTLNANGLSSEPRGGIVGYARPVADWQATDFVGFTEGLKCADEPIMVTAHASRSGALLIAECEDVALKAELDGTPLPKLTDYDAEATWQSLLAEADQMVDLGKVTQVALWGSGGLDGRPWFTVSGLAAASDGSECEMQWSRKPDPLDEGDHTVPPATLAGCLGINAQAVTFDLTKVSAADIAAAVATAAEQVGEPADEVMTYTIVASDGALVLNASWGMGERGKAQVVIAEQAP